MKYRIKHIDMIGYFAQVKPSVFSTWKTIGKHTNGFGEYESDHLDYPLLCQSDAVLLAHKHADYNKNRKGFTSYREFMI